MKKHYTKTLLFIALTLMAVFQLSAQTVEFLNANNVNAGIGIGGNLFSLLTDTAFDLYEVPRSSNKKAIYTASLWMTGLDTGGNLYGAAQQYSEFGPNYYDGPIASVYDSIYDKYYKRVFKVTQQQVNQYRALTFPATAAQVDSAILMWPGKGNPFVAASFGVNIGSGLAPFVDLNNNGFYEPLNGDYPAICGDEAIFFALNDVRGISGIVCQKLGVEIRGLASVFVDTLSTGLPPEKRVVNNTVFVEYEVENKSATNYNNFYLGLFEDPDLGCFENDRVGCDTVRNMMFVYNGTTPDPDCQGETGYGNLTVSQGTIMLNKNMSSFGYYTNGTLLSQSDPTSCSQVRNYMTGYWNDGTPFTEGSTGYGGTIPTKFIFPGDPNDSTSWSELSAANILAPGDRRMTGSTGPVTFAIGDILHYDFAFSTSYDSTSTMFKIVDTLKHDADIVQAFYNNNILGCRSQLVAASVNEVKDGALSVSVFPNPANAQINIVAAENIQMLEMTDIEGRLVLQKGVTENRTTINTSIFARGVYLLKVKSEGRSVVKKIVLE